MTEAGSAPKLPSEQTAALANAITVRRARAQIKRAVNAGTRSVSSVLADIEGDQQITGRIRVIDLVEAVDGIGPQRAAEALHAAKINPDDRLNRLGKLQIKALGELLG